VLDTTTLQSPNDADQHALATSAAAQQEAALPKAFKAALRTMWITKGSRFTAHRRLKMAQLASTFIQVMLSILVIFATMLPLVYKDKVPGTDQAFISISTMVLSVFIVTLSVLESSKEFSVRAERMLRSGQKISELYNELQGSFRKHQANAGTIEQHFNSIAEVTKKYEQVISDFSENHDDIDYLYFVHVHGQSPAKTGGFWRRAASTVARAWYVCRYQFSIYGFYLVLISVPFLALWAYVAHRPGLIDYFGG
jgi:hypothetical protein